MNVLFLAHRIPFPPDKGDKIRSCHLMQALAGRCRLYLGAFVDSPDDWRHATSLREYCEEIALVPLPPLPALLRVASGLLGRQPATLHYYRSRQMRRWVQGQLRARPIDAVVIFSAAMAQYLPSGRQGPRRIVDFVDVDSDKWRQYAGQARWPLSWIYGREARTLLRFERQVAAGADASIFVSEAEAELFRSLAPEVASRVFSTRNGVDAAYFDPSLEFANPYHGSSRVILFSGAMDYRANVDAVTWFARALLPRIRSAAPEAQFFIVGARPAADVLQLAKLEGVTVTGRVADMRPYLAHAQVSVAPLRLARGVQNKVLEALAMNCPVVATSAALRGLDDTAVPGVVIANTDSEFVGAVLRQLAVPKSTEAAGRSYVLRRYDWARNLSQFLAVALGDAPQAQRA